jgi:hypothetical protein
VRQHPGNAAARSGNPAHREANASRSPFTSGAGGNQPYPKLPLPEGLRAEDRELWPKLLREEQEEALDNLKRHPGKPLAWLKLRPGSGSHWSYYPWRTEAESSSARLADDVVRGDRTIESYLRLLELLELSKPFAHPNVLTKDREGRWQLMDPNQVPLPAMTPERAALPEGSPERIYWPYKSKAEHYAMLRAEMVLRGHLSLDQYKSLNAWASRHMNEKYPDPLENLVGNISAKRDGEVREGEAPGEPPRNGVGSLWPEKTLDQGTASSAKDSRPPGEPERSASPRQGGQEQSCSARR